MNNNYKIETYYDSRPSWVIRQEQEQHRFEKEVAQCESPLEALVKYSATKQQWLLCRKEHLSWMATEHDEAIDQETKIPQAPPATPSYIIMDIIPSEEDE